MSAAPEQAILRALLEAARRVGEGMDEARDLLGPVPATQSAYAALDKVQRTAATAILKRFEQLQDILSRLMRTALIADGIDIGAFTTRDIANRLEKLNALPDARQWSEIVRLRNRLAHEYPVGAEEQLSRLTDVLARASDLSAIHLSLQSFLREQQLVP